LTDSISTVTPDKHATGEARQDEKERRESGDGSTGRMTATARADIEAELAIQRRTIDFSNHRLQRVLVHAQIGHQLLEPRILISKLLGLLRLANR
jgi:hypothetical protein